jgi:hypothetical protein
MSEPTDAMEIMMMMSGLDRPRRKAEISKEEEAAITAAVQANPSNKDYLCYLLSRPMSLAVLTYVHQHPRSKPAEMNEALNGHLRRREEVLGSRSMRSGCQVIGRYLHELRRAGFVVRHHDLTWSLKA